MKYKSAVAAIAVITAGLIVIGTATSAAASPRGTAISQGLSTPPPGFEPGVDRTLVVDVCPFPMKVHDQVKWFKEVLEPNGAWDYNLDGTATFTNLDTGKQWQVKGSSATHWVGNPDGSVTQTTYGVGVAFGPLHTVYYGVWTRTFPDGVPGPLPFTGIGKTVDICAQVS